MSPSRPTPEARSSLIEADLVDGAFPSDTTQMVDVMPTISPTIYDAHGAASIRQSQRIPLTDTVYREREPVAAAQRLPSFTGMVCRRRPGCGGRGRRSGF